jgi:hypothetical protein
MTRFSHAAVESFRTIVFTKLLREIDGPLQRLDVCYTCIVIFYSAAGRNMCYAINIKPLIVL